MKQGWVALVAIGLASFQMMLAPAVRAGGVEYPQAPAPRLPVILIHGLASGPAVWGDPAAPQVGSLARRLEDEGYRPGRTLFWPDYADDANGDFLTIARERLAPLVQRALAAAGTRQVDLVAHSMGGLVARAYLTLVPEGTVRQLVMIGTPNRGAFTADLLKTVVTGRRFLDQERMLPAPALPPVRNWPVYRGEAEYIAAVAHRFWEPALLQYVLQARLSVPESTPPSAMSWLNEQAPALVRALGPAAEAPPHGSWGIGDLPRRSPGPGQGLAAAYYNLLALKAAQWRLAMLPGGAVPLERPPAAKSPLRTWLSWVWQAVRTRLAAWGTGVVEERLAIDPTGVALDRLISETVRDEADGLLARVVPANRVLAELNGREAETWRTRATAFVYINGVVPNLWRAIFPQVAKNDGVVATDESLLPPGPLDSRHFLSGLSQASHTGLLTSRRVQGTILEVLKQPLRPQPLFDPWWRRWFPPQAPWPNAVFLGEGRGSVENRPLVVGPLPGQARWIGVRGAAPGSWLAWLWKDGQVRPLPNDGRGAGFSVRHAGGGYVVLRPGRGQQTEWRMGTQPVSVQVWGESGPPRPVAEASKSRNQARHPYEPVIPVVLHNKQTTHWQPRREALVRWRWQVDEVGAAPETGVPVWQSRSGQSVWISGYTQAGRRLYRVRRSGVSSGGMVRFAAPSVTAAEPHITFEGPVAWVIGRPAQFAVAVQVPAVAKQVEQQVEVNPGRRFTVVWKRPGRFTVTAAVRVRTTYAGADWRFTLTNVYVVAHQVEVLATALSP